MIWRLKSLPSARRSRSNSFSTRHFCSFPSASAASLGPKCGTVCGQLWAGGLCVRSIRSWRQSRIRLCTLFNAADRTPLRALRGLFVQCVAPLPEISERVSLSLARASFCVLSRLPCMDTKRRAVEGRAVVAYNPPPLSITHAHHGRLFSQSSTACALAIHIRDISCTCSAHHTTLCRLCTDHSLHCTEYTVTACDTHTE